MTEKSVSSINRHTFADVKNKVLVVDKLTKSFPGILALNQVSFDLHEGEVHALCGENGAGKSTLIKCLSGIFSATSYSGDIGIKDEQQNWSVANFSSIRDAESAGIGVICQELALVKEMTVAENIFLGNEPANAWGKINWHRLYAKTFQLLKRYNLNLDPNTKIADLGIGQQQLVEIVKALSKNTRILLLDEPTAALTEREVAILLDIIRSLKSRAVTCVYISHKLDEVMTVADRITVLRDGASVSTRSIKETDKADIIQQMVGRRMGHYYPRRDSSPGSVLLKVEGLTVLGPENKQKLKNISFALKAGEVLGFGGLMGAGRTELMLHLFGAYGQRVSGSVELFGCQLINHSPLDAIRAGMMIVSEDRKRYGLVLDKSIGFNQSLASLPQFNSGLLLNETAEARANQDYFQSLQVKAPGLGTRVAGLSGGNQQKVVLAKALMTHAKLIILDEPTRGIDIGAKVEIYALIKQLTEQGKGVLLVSSEMPELLGMSDRIMVLSAGKIAGEFEAGETDQQALLHAAMRYC